MEPGSAVDAFYATDNHEAGRIVGAYAAAKARELDVDWRHLQLERAELARNARVDSLAREELKMTSIVPDRTIFINQPQSTQNGAEGGAK